MKRLEQKILEASLARIWKLSKDHIFGIITAFRGNLKLADNLKRNKDLASKVRAAGYGFVMLEGHWVENENTPEEIEVKEDSLFISTSDATKGEELEKFIIKMLKKYDQDSGIIKDSVKSSDIYFIDKAGKKVKAGTFKAKALGKNYSKMKKDKRPFVFERFDFKNAIS